MAYVRQTFHIILWHLTPNSWHWKEEKFCKLLFEIINSELDLPNGWHLYKLLKYLYFFFFLTITGSFFIPQESLFYCTKKLHSTNTAETLTCLFVKPVWQSLPDVDPLKPDSTKGYKQKQRFAGWHTMLWKDGYMLLNHSL